MDGWRERLPLFPAHRVAGLGRGGRRPLGPDPAAAGPARRAVRSGRPCPRGRPGRGRRSAATGVCGERGCPAGRGFLRPLRVEGSARPRVAGTSLPSGVPTGFKYQPAAGVAAGGPRLGGPGARQPNYLGREALLQATDISLFCVKT